MIQYKDKEKARSDNLDYYARKAADPIWRAEQAARAKDYRDNHMPLKVLQNWRRRTKLFNQRRQIWRRALALDHYGGCCACCGENKDYFLAIDHIDGGGSKHKKEVRFWRLSDWLFRNNWPDGFQILCHNCNTAKYRFGTCPCGEV